MADIIITERTEQSGSTVLRVETREDCLTLSKGKFTVTETSYADTYIKTMLAGGISTPVHHRRGGNVRKMFEYMHSYAAKNEGAALALLHPFSFSYYRKFGYEKVADHLIVRCPTRMIDFVPRRCAFVPYDESRFRDLVSIYEKFSRGRNLLLKKKKLQSYSKDKQSTYIYYENGEPAAYVVYSYSHDMMVNHYINTLLTVHEMAYTSPSALREIFSFLRMFEGEYEEIEFYNLAPCPEAELLLKHYTHTSYKLVPDLMARVLDTKTLLSSHSYPQKEGGFSVKVEDVMPSVAGVYKVAYGNGEAEVKRLDDLCEADITLSPSALVRLIYGYDGIDQRSAAYMDGVQINKDASDFFSAFRKTPCGMFEHF